MSDLKITQLTEDTEPTYDDLIMTVNAPGGSPGNKKVQFTNVSKALGWVDVRSYVSINAAVTAIGATHTTLVVPNAQTLTASVTLTIPTTLSLVILNGGSIVKASGSALIINGPFEAGLYQVFSGFSAGDVTFGAGSVKEVHPECWGAKSDGVTDSTVAIQAAIDSIRSLPGGKITFSRGDYVITTTLNLTNIYGPGINLVGSDKRASRLILNTSGTVGLDFVGSAYYSIQDLGIEGGAGALAPNIGILMARNSGNAGGDPYLHNLFVHGEFTQTSIFNYAIEGGVYNKVTIEMGGAAESCFTLADYNRYSATSPYATIQTGHIVTSVNQFYGFQGKHEAGAAGAAGVSALRLDGNILDVQFYGGYLHVKVGPTGDTNSCLKIYSENSSYSPENIKIDGMRMEANQGTHAVYFDGGATGRPDGISLTNCSFYAGTGYAIYQNPAMGYLARCNFENNDLNQFNAGYKFNEITNSVFIMRAACGIPTNIEITKADNCLFINNDLGTITITTSTGNIIIKTGGTLTVGSAQITAGSGTGVTVDSIGHLNHQVYKVTVTYAALAAAALTADKVIATLPAKTRLVAIIADTTIAYTGGAVSAATIQVGKTTGGSEYIISHDVFSGTITKGLVDADLGTSINRANAVQEGDLPSWTGTTPISVRLTTVTANTNVLTQGSTTYYLTCERY